MRPVLCPRGIITDIMPTKTKPPKITSTQTNGFQDEAVLSSTIHANIRGWLKKDQSGPWVAPWPRQKDEERQ
ncbi:hypothetical protein H103_02562, partial [Trichophyton rubrum CBS 288.86]